MKKIVVLFLHVIVTTSAQITVTESTTEKFSFDWNMQDVKIEQILNKNKKYSTVSFTDGDVSIGETGEPVLPAKSIIVGIPLKGDIKVSVEPREIRTIKLQYPLEFHEKPTHNNFKAKVSENKWCTSTKYCNTQQYRLGKFLFCPVLYDSSTASLLILQKATCIVTFPESASKNVNGSTIDSDYETMIAKTMFNYHLAKTWRRGSSLAKKNSSIYPITTSQISFRFEIGDGHSGVNEGTTKENGIIKITGDSIVNIFGHVRIQQVKLYASGKGELNDEPCFDSIPAGIHEIPLFRNDANGNGLVDNEDFLIAHVTGASDWYFDKARNEYDFKLNRYDDNRHYFLTVSNDDATKSERFISLAGFDDTLSSYENKIFLKCSNQQKYQVGSSYWIWTKLTNEVPSFVHRLDLPEPVQNDSGKIIIGSESLLNCTVYLGNQILYKNGYRVTKYIKNWDKRDLTIKYSGGTDAIDLESIKIFYRRFLEAGPFVYMEVFSPKEPGIFNYDLKITTDELLYLFKISDDERTFSLIDTIKNKNNTHFYWADSGATGARYIICSEKSFLKFPQLTKDVSISDRYVIKDLRSQKDSTDYLIITNSAFIKYAVKLADHKKSVGFTSPKIAVLDDIFKSFSGGNFEPVAIRNFITYVKQYWKSAEKLSYVLLVGAGHYDYKNITTKEPVYVPVYYPDLGSTPSDDFYTIVHNNGLPELCIGRLPCKTEADAAAMVEKIITMESPSRGDFSEWRNRTLLVADDDLQHYEPDTSNIHFPHYKSSERMYDLIHSKWPSMYIGKVYLYDYKWNDLREKPDASQAIIERINNGIGYVNFFGHGAYELWTDERILTPDAILKLNNKSRYPLVSSFSCSVGEFDKPGETCLSALMVIKPDAGAIAALSSSRESTADNNEYLAKTFYSYLFDSTKTVAIGTALTRSKIITANANSYQYMLLGDPSICMVKSKYRITVQIADTNNVMIDTLKALQKVVIKGSITDKKGAIVKNYGSQNKPATVKITLLNPVDTVLHRSNVNPDSLVIYNSSLGIVCSRTASVINGVFTQNVLIPKNVYFDKADVLLTAYSWNQENDFNATGVKKDLIFHGSNTDFSDSVGPEISIKPIYEFNNSSDLRNVNVNDKLILDTLKVQVELYDESGIDATGYGPDEGLTMEIPGKISKQNINSLFQFKDGDFRSGTAIIRETSLKPGMYTLKITGRDLIGNLTEKIVPVEILQEAPLKIYNTFNSPNPMKMGKSTRFYFYSSNTSHAAEATIKIYTLSGRPVKIFKNAVSGQVWDGCDQVGNRLSPDIYLYQITLYSADLKKSALSKIGKIVLHPPR